MLSAFIFSLVSIKGINNIATASDIAAVGLQRPLGRNEITQSDGAGGIDQAATIT